MKQDDVARPGGSDLSEVLGAGSKAKKPSARLYWGLDVYCPKCGWCNDIASGLHDAEQSIARHIFSNAWDKLNGWEVTCEGCGHEFEIESVEY